MQKRFKIFFSVGFGLLLLIYFVFLVYYKKYIPLIPNAPLPLNTLPASDSSIVMQHYCYDVENISNSDMVQFGNAHSGKASLRTNGNQKINWVISKPLQSLQSLRFNEVRLQAYVKFGNINQSSGRLFFQIVSNKNRIKYSSDIFINEIIKSDTAWFFVSGLFELKGFSADSTDYVKIFLYHESSTPVYVDDICFRLGYKQNNDTVNAIDLTTLQGDFIQKTQQPPYPQLRFKKVLGLTFIPNSVDTLISKTIKILTGNFSSKLMQQVLCIHENEKGTIVWLDDALNKIQRKHLCFENTGKNEWQHAITADVNGDKISELIVKSHSRNMLLIYRADIRNSTFTVFDSLMIPEFSEISWFAAHKSVESIHDGILVGNSMGTLKWVTLKNRQWLSQSLGTYPELESKNKICKVLSGKFVAGSSAENLLCLLLDKTNGVCKLTMFDFPNTKNRLSPIFVHHFTNCSDTLSPLYEFGMADMDNDGLLELFSFSHNWRNDVKCYKFYNDTYTILGRVSFTDYFKDYDPIYYENLMIGVGNFFDNQKSIGIMTLNTNFNSYPDLPDGIDFYVRLPYSETYHEK